MDDNGQIIPIVEDDQGEGWKDLLEVEGLEERMSRHEKELQKAAFRATSNKHSRKPK